MPIVHTTCLGSNADPAPDGTCPVCHSRQRIYKDRDGAVTIWPHQQPAP